MNCFMFELMKNHSLFSNKVILKSTNCISNDINALQHRLIPTFNNTIMFWAYFSTRNALWDSKKKRCRKK